MAYTTRRNGFCGRTKAPLLGEGHPRRLVSYEKKEARLHAASTEAGISTPSLTSPTQPDLVLNTVVVLNVIKNPIKN